MYDICLDTYQAGEGEGVLLRGIGKLFLNEFPDLLLSRDRSRAEELLSRDERRSLFRDVSLPEMLPSLAQDLSLDNDRSLDSDLSRELYRSLESDLSLELYLFIAGGREDLGIGFRTLSLQRKNTLVGQ